MKHGPIALHRRRLPVVVLIPRDSSYERMIGNLEEVRAREGRVIAIGHEGDPSWRPRPTTCSRCRRPGELLTPMLLSMLRCSCSPTTWRCGAARDVDQPRNLAKSVTVE